MKQLYVAALALLTALPATGQQQPTDYVVTTAGDTLRGQLRISNQRQIRLLRRGQPAQVLTAREVRSAGSTTGPFLVSRPVRGQAEPQFLAPLVQGTVSLFSGVNADKQKRYYVQAQDSAAAVELPPETRRLALLRALPPCPSLDLERGESEVAYPYRYSGMVSLVQAYNTCLRPGVPSRLVKRPAGTEVLVGAKAGWLYPAFEPYTKRRDQRQGTSYLLGAMWQLHNLSPWSVQLEATYAWLRASYGPYPIFNGYAFYTTTETAHIHTQQVQLPVLLRYSVGHGTTRPYVALGPSFGLYHNNKSELEAFQSNLPGSTRRPLRFNGNSTLDGVAGLGVQMRRSGWPALNAELRGARNLPVFLPDQAGTSFSYSLSVNVGVLF